MSGNIKGFVILMDPLKILKSPGRVVLVVLGRCVMRGGGVFMLSLEGKIICLRRLAGMDTPPGILGAGVSQSAVGLCFLAFFQRSFVCEPETTRIHGLLV